MSNRAVISPTTGLEDAERVTVALLVAVGTACEGCPSIPNLMGRYAAADGRLLLCPICFNSKQLDSTALVSNAELGDTVQLWAWIGDEGATTFSY